MWEIYDTELGVVIDVFATREEAQEICDNLCEFPWIVRPTKEHTMSLSITTLAAEAQKRYDKMSNNPEYHGNPDLTYSKFVLDKVAELEQLLKADASTRLETEPVVNYSEKDRKRLLAAKVVAGVYDA